VYIFGFIFVFSFVLVLCCVVDVICWCVCPEALAGPDGFDSRQGPPGRVFPTSFDPATMGDPLPAANNDYLSDIEGGVSGMRIGVVTEGFANCDPEVVAAVRHSLKVYKDLGAVVEEVPVQS